jgi:preprotein translocase subunit SecA
VLSNLEIRAAQPEALAPRERTQEMHEGREDPALAGTPQEPEEELAATGTEGPLPQPRGGAGLATAPRPQPVASRAAAATLDPTDPSTWGRVPRNAPCPCGSGKKFKHCHGKV